MFVEQGQRRIPVQFAKRVVGRRMYGGQSTYIPLKVNQSGVIPIIFASSVLLPAGAAHQRAARPTAGGATSRSWINDNLVQPDSIVYIALYGLLIIGFAYFYTAITFDPAQQADNIRKQGGFIPGIRPGPQTERYLAQDPLPHHAARRPVHRRHRPAPVAAAGVSPTCGNFPFGGTSMLIAVGVALETMKQIDSQLMMRNYEGFLK